MAGGAGLFPAASRWAERVLRPLFSPAAARAALLLTALSFGFPAFSGAAGPVIIDETFSHVRIGLQMDLLQNPSGELAIGGVTSGEAARRFAPARENIPNIGFTPSAIWARFTVRNTLARPAPLYLQLGNNLDDVIDLYDGTDTGPFRARHAGQTLPFAAREVSHRAFVFGQTLAPGEMRTFYLRIQSLKSVFADINLWTPEAFGQAARGEYAALGLYFGILLVMLVYNLILYLFLKERLYLYYVFYVFFVGLTMISFDGLGYQYLWPQNVWFEANSIVIFYGVAFFFGVLFNRAFLDTPRHTPRLDKVFQGLMGAALTVIFITLFVAPRLGSPLINMLSLSLVLLLGAGYYIYFKGYRPARYFVVAWTFFLAGLVVLALKHFGALQHNFFTLWSFQIGSGLEIILLSLALGDRIALMREQKEEAETLAREALEKLNERLEALVAERTAELRFSEERFRGLANATFEGVLIHENGSIVDANPQAESMFGRTGGGLAGTPLASLFDHAGGDLMEKTGRAGNEPLEFTARRPDGSLFSAEVRLQSTSFMGRPAGVAAVRDISLRKRIEIELRDSKEKAEDAVRLKDRFVSMVSHDIRSPIGSLLVALGIIKTGLAGSAPARHMTLIERMEHSCRNLIETLDGLLTIGRIKSGRMELKLSPVDLRSAAALSIGRIEMLANEKGITLCNEVPETTRIIADRLLLAEVLQNLLTNAIKFSFRQSRIELFRPSGAPAAISVRNFGTVIPEEQLKNLFNGPGVKSSAGTEGEKGTGLGLLFCAEIMAVHSGRIWAESSPETGTVFHLEFPHAPITALVVVRNGGFKERSRRLLEAEGLAVLVADQGIAALEAAAAGKVHLAVVESAIGVSDGVGVIEVLKTSGGTKDMRVIAVCEAEGDPRAGLADDFVSVSVTDADFSARVKKLLA